MPTKDYRPEDYPDWLGRQIKAGQCIFLPNVLDENKNYAWTIENASTSENKEEQDGI